MCYQFLRFVKATRVHIGDIAVNVLSNIEVILKENQVGLSIHDVHVIINWLCVHV